MIRFINFLLSFFSTRFLSVLFLRFVVLTAFLFLSAPHEKNTHSTFFFFLIFYYLYHTHTHSRLLPALYVCTLSLCDDVREKFLSILVNLLCGAVPSERNTASRERVATTQGNKLSLLTGRECECSNLFVTLKALIFRSNTHTKCRGEGACKLEGNSLKFILLLSLLARSEPEAEEDTVRLTKRPRTHQKIDQKNPRL
jgi:hypothetical protein